VKRSRKVALLVLGSLASLTACDSGREFGLQQRRYASLEECEKDWGDSAPCTNGSSSALGGTYGYFGPRYYWDPGIGRPVIVSPSGDTQIARSTRITSESAFSGEVAHVGTVSRGGFGGFGRGFSIGG